MTQMLPQPVFLADVHCFIELKRLDTIVTQEYTLDPLHKIEDHSIHIDARTLQISRESDLYELLKNNRSHLGRLTHTYPKPWSHGAAHDADLCEMSVLTEDYMKNYKNEYHSHSCLDVNQIKELMRSNANLKVTSSINDIKFGDLFTGRRSESVMPFSVLLYHYLNYLCINGPLIPISEQQLMISSRLHNKKQSQHRWRTRRQHSTVDYQIQSSDDIEKRYDSNLPSYYEYDRSDAILDEGDIFMLPESRWLSNVYLSDSSPMRRIYQYLYELSPLPVALVDCVIDYTANEWTCRVIFAFDGYIW